MEITAVDDIMQIALMLINLRVACASPILVIVPYPSNVVGSSI
jgi:hypothetical protein